MMIFIAESQVSNDTDETPPLVKVSGQDGLSADVPPNRSAEGEIVGKENSRKRTAAMSAMPIPGLDDRSDKFHIVNDLESVAPGSSGAPPMGSCP